MRALEKLQRQHPTVHAVIVGGDEVSYGRAPRDAPNWREKMLREVKLDGARAHFMDSLQATASDMHLGSRAIVDAQAYADTAGLGRYTALMPASGVGAMSGVPAPVSLQPTLNHRMATRLDPKTERCPA
jgi:hypothetical protein